MLREYYHNPKGSTRDMSNFVPKDDLRLAYHDLLQRYYEQVERDVYDPVEMEEVEYNLNELSIQFLQVPFIPGGSY